MNKEESNSSSEKEKEKKKIEMEFDKARLKMDNNNSSSEKEKEKEKEKKITIEKNDEYICCLCGFLGSEFLDSNEKSSSCNQQQFAHRYCILKNRNRSKRLEQKQKQEMSEEHRVFFKRLEEDKISVIDHFKLSVVDFIMKNRNRRSD